MVFGWFNRKQADGRSQKSTSQRGLPSGAWQSCYINDYLSGKDDATTKDFCSLAKDVYLDNVIAYRCVRMTSEGCSAIPVNVFCNGYKAAAHPVLSLLRSPSPLQSRSDFFDDIFSYLQIAGNVYVQMVKDQEGGHAELYVLRPDRVNITTDENGWVSAYEYSVGGKKVSFPAIRSCGQVLHLKSFHPLNDHYGFSGAGAAVRSVAVHNAATKWNRSLLDNAARPSGALVYKGGDGDGHLSHTQYERLINELENDYQGAVNAGRPLLLEGGLDWKPMGFSPSDMEFMETRNIAAREIASAFGVPPMLLGIPGDNTYSNYHEANKAFMRDTVFPLVQKVYSKFSIWFSEYFSEDVRLEPVLDALPSLSDERDSLWNRVSRADFLSDEEKRKLLGIDGREGE